MKTKFLKEQLRQAYSRSPSSREKAFLRQYTRRHIGIGRLCRIAFDSLGLSVSAALILFLLGVYALATLTDPGSIWGISFLCSLSALWVILLSDRSRRHGMEELEMSTRFSLKLLMTVRLLYSGFFSLLGLGMAAIFLCSTLHIRALYVLMYMGIPYLATVYGNILILRHWHARENLYGCAAVSCLCGLAMIAQLWKSLSVLTVLGLFLVLLVLALREILHYIKESEVLSWSLS